MILKRIILLISLITALNPFQVLADNKIKVGVSTSLTGDATAFGVDIQNALTLMNDKFGNGKYQLIFEDDKCENNVGVSVAHKLINVDKVRYVLGFPCNSILLATAAIYEKADVLVLTSAGNSGDVLDIGKNIFRLFPSDAAGAKLLFSYMTKRHKKIAMLTEQNEYPVMMGRTVIRENEKLQKPLEIVTEDFLHGTTDLRSTILKLMSKKVEGIFVNANTDASFITAVKQLRGLKYQGALYAAYLPASATVLKELGDAVNGFIFANLPLSDELVTPEGKLLLDEFRKRFGEPQSGFPVVPTSLEAFRIFDLALQSKNPQKFLLNNKFSGGFIPDYYFDEHGAVQGINFQMQKIEDGKVVVINK